MEFVNETCRVCLEDGMQCNSLFDEVEYDICIPLAEIYKKVTNIEITYSEEFKPLNLCNQCTERLLSAYEFICKVEKAEKDIELFLNEQTIEILDDEQNTITKIEEIEASDTETQDLEILEDEFETIKQEYDENDTSSHFLAQAIIEIDDNSINEDKDAIPDVKNTKPAIGSRLGKRLASGCYKCEDCYRTFAKLETLARHKQNAHTYLPLEELAVIAPQANGIDKNKKRIPCPHCPRDFVRRDNYVRHLITSHSDKAELLSPEDRQLAKVKHKYKKCLCPHCGESFSQGSLIIHIRRHTGENPYKCNECHKGFPRRQDLVLHQRQHTGERPHICTVCGKSFTRANKLARHMRIHTGERPYKCTKCTRSFIQSNDLKIHMRRHTGEKPYKCKVCSEAFICGAALKTHRRLKNHHLPGDDEDDPLINWRVSTRKSKTFSKRKTFISTYEERNGQQDNTDQNTVQSSEEDRINMVD